MLADSISTPVNTEELTEQEEQGGTMITHSDIVLKVKARDVSSCNFKD